MAQHLLGVSTCTKLFEKTNEVHSSIWKLYLRMNQNPVGWQLSSEYLTWFSQNFYWFHKWKQCVWGLELNDLLWQPTDETACVGKCICAALQMNKEKSTVKSYLLRWGQGSRCLLVSCSFFIFFCDDKWKMCFISVINSESSLILLHPSQLVYLSLSALICLHLGQNTYIHVVQK